MAAKLRVPFLVLVTCLVAEPARAQVRIDLAQISAGTTVSFPVTPGAAGVVVTSQVPTKKYDVTITRELVPIDAFTTPDIPWLKPSTAPERARQEIAEADPCARLRQEVSAARALEDESMVPPVVERLERRLASEECKDSAVRDEASALLRRATLALTAFPIRAGERVVVTIERHADESGAERRTWNVVLDAGPRGSWLTMYGLGIVPGKDERYLSKAESDGRFTITRETGVSELTFVPSIFYSWVSREQQLRNWALSPTAGLGLTKELPAVFVGGSAIFNQNLAVTLGLGAYGQKRLSGQYTPGQSIGENLSKDQLERRILGTGWLIAVTYRFASNPTSGAAGGGGSAGGAGGTPATPQSSGGAAPPPATPATPASPPAGGVSEAGGRDADLKLFVDAKGNLAPASQNIVAEALARAQDATDVFLVSHGWWNDPRTADCFYRRMIAGIVARRPDYLTPDRFRPVFIGVYWPSALFPVEAGDCAESGRAERSRLESAAPATAGDAIRSWAAAAFPEAADRPEFTREAERVAALLEKERNAVLTAVEAEELVRLLQQWRRLSDVDPDPGSEGPEAERFQGDAGAIVRDWQDRPAASADVVPEASTPGKWLNMANAFTFWTMKKRAGVVGSRAVYDVLRALQPLRARGVRIHLVGHSFGGKLLAAALTGHGRGAPNRADSGVILQGAFSQFAFATAQEIQRLGVATENPGKYVDIVSSRLVAGSLAVTFSALDHPNRFVYPAGVALVGDVLERAAAPRYGSLGANGIRGPSAAVLVLGQERLRDEFGIESPALVSVDASDVILGHSDLIKEAVFDLIWDVVESAPGAGG